MNLALLTVLFAAIYIPTILSEEAYLREHFAGYEAYARAVPRLLPRGHGAARRWPWKEESGRGRFFDGAIFHHREYNSTMGAGAIYLALVLKMLLLFTLRGSNFLSFCELRILE